jgi:hypothetical protein
MSQLTDPELLDAFFSQEDRQTHSGMMLSDCFSPGQFDLVFEYGTVIQKSAVRQALIACLSLPSIEPGLEVPPRNATFEKHLENLLLHALRSIAADERVPRRERVATSLLVEATLIGKLSQLVEHTRARAGTGCSAPEILDAQRHPPTRTAQGVKVACLLGQDAPVFYVMAIGPQKRMRMTIGSAPKRACTS